LGATGFLKALVLVALFGWLYSSHITRLYHYWLRPDWSHGFLIPLFGLYLVHNKRGELLLGEHRGSLWGAAVMLLSVGAYVASIVWKIGYPQPLTMVGVIAGVVLLVRGWRTLWLTLFPIGFLILAMPPPERLYRAVTQPLQMAAAAIAAQALNVFPGADVERAGINIAYAMSDGRSGQFTVAGACSGMRSLMAFVALGLAMAYFTARPTWHRVAMAVLVVPVAAFCNIVRVIVTGGLQMAGQPSLASGTPHTVLGLLLFGLGFAIYLGVLWILDNLFTEERIEDAGASGSEQAVEPGTK
jgi:exosortase